MFNYNYRLLVSSFIINFLVIYLLIFIKYLNIDVLVNYLYSKILILK